MCLPPRAEQVVSEVFRVARKVLVFGYPCGPAAFELDQRLHRDYQSRKFLALLGWKSKFFIPFPMKTSLESCQRDGREW